MMIMIMRICVLKKKNEKRICVNQSLTRNKVAVVESFVLYQNQTSSAYG